MGFGVDIYNSWVVLGSGVEIEGDIEIGRR